MPQTQSGLPASRQLLPALRRRGKPGLVTGAGSQRKQTEEGAHFRLLSEKEKAAGCLKPHRECRALVPSTPVPEEMRDRSAPPDLAQPVPQMRGKMAARNRAGLVPEPQAL